MIQKSTGAERGIPCPEPRDICRRKTAVSSQRRTNIPEAKIIDSIPFCPI
jgi:hypothetical protein